ncbi:MAG: hypothetical protein R3C68_10105 [Myxococcota bacterium]
MSTEGIQRGHMTLHARSCAVAAGATPEVFETLVEKLIESGEIKIWKAKEILGQLEVGGDARNDEPERVEARASYAAGHGKVILLANTQRST